MRFPDEAAARAYRPGAVMRPYGGLLVAALLVAGCSADSDARDGEAPAGGARPEASTPEFLEAYEAGFQRGIADGKSQPGDDVAVAQPADRDFAARWDALSGLAVPDVDAYVRSGAADEWLDRRYRSLGFAARDLDSANALLFLANWEAFTGLAATPAQVAGVRRQIAMHAGGVRSQETSPELELRRRVYELMAATLTRENARVRAAADETQVAAFAATVRSDFERLSNNDLAGLALTAEGFQER